MTHDFGSKANFLFTWGQRGTHGAEGNTSGQYPAGANGKLRSSGNSRVYLGAISCCAFIM